MHAPVSRSPRTDPPLLLASTRAVAGPPGDAWPPSFA